MSSEYKMVFADYPEALEREINATCQTLARSGRRVISVQHSATTVKPKIANNRDGTCGRPEYLFTALIEYRFNWIRATFLRYEEN